MWLINMGVNTMRSLDSLHCAGYGYTDIIHLDYCYKNISYKPFWYKNICSLIVSLTVGVCVPKADKIWEDDV